ncbi:penicillin-insensitive murein endopeptidase [Methylocystis parvus]|uniref:Penicillin-insensitive murein endopeptidase n=1 Tax=Methylocystis parvus TaxID=134 RepID=A0A6B8M3W9_9HYPH|nr:penicillin-insensitive murein endopeptidase [Methylocystis parvus]QGM97008.1 penicillin-insensitive murein endopeptidase [Methylocystis parvus]WBJ99097.1 penicillin-insensitive murein endopeptidase [Methylocystis parvus OBBP]
MRASRFAAAILALAFAGGAAAQDKGTLDPKPLPPLANPSDPSTPAKELFGRARDGASLEPDPIGFYSKGCLAGGEQLPYDGAHWQVMRPSRNRNWGHPNLLKFLESFSARAAAAAGWPGLLIGDMSQPRGGPMLTGHASHQIGLDADIWLTPMPTRELTRAEREEMSATDVVREDLLDVRSDVWSEGHLAVIRTAAQDPKVQRIFVNAAIKRALCREAEGEAWMRKIRPMFGHNYHFHIRLFCPDGSSCRDQDPTPPGDGCDQSLAWWFTDEALHPKKSNKSWPPMSMAALPAACRDVLKAR